MDRGDRDSLTDKNKVEERRLKMRDQIQKEKIEKGKACRGGAAKEKGWNAKVHCN
jgi:hypothetical protein